MVIGTSSRMTLFHASQTGAGKTYTMFGGDGDEAAGLVPRCCTRMFELLERRSCVVPLYTVRSTPPRICLRWILGTGVVLGFGV